MIIKTAPVKSWDVVGALASKIWFGSTEKDDFFKAFSKLIISSSVPSTRYMGFDVTRKTEPEIFFEFRRTFSLRWGEGAYENENPCCI